MKSVITTLSLALVFGAFVAAARPAHADFFEEPFRSDAHVSASQSPAPAAPRQSTETVRTVEKASLVITDNSGTPIQYRITEWTRDAQWTLPVSNPTQYKPMQ